MPVNISGTTLTGGTTLTVTDSSSNQLFYQDSNGVTYAPRLNGGSTSIPLFNVGWSSETWVTMGGTIPFAYTSGNGYQNVGGCYNTSTYAFTAPWTGVYLFKMHIYIYGPNSTYGWYCHPEFIVNGSYTTRRPGGTPYRMRLYGMRADYGQDTDCCELIYMVAGDYTQAYVPVSGTVQGYAQYSAWSGAYMGAIA